MEDKLIYKSQGGRFVFYIINNGYSIRIFDNIDDSFITITLDDLENLMEKIKNDT